MYPGAHVYKNGAVWRSLALVISSGFVPLYLGSGTYRALDGADVHGLLASWQYALRNDLQEIYLLIAYHVSYTNLKKHINSFKEEFLLNQ